MTKSAASARQQGAGSYKNCFIIKKSQMTREPYPRCGSGLARDQALVSDVVNGVRFSDTPLLVGLRAASNARDREGLSDGAAVDQVRAVLGLPEPTGALVTRWAADPFARGSYSFLAVGSSPDDQRALAEPVGDRLHFAG